MLLNANVTIPFKKFLWQRTQLSAALAHKSASPKFSKSKNWQCISIVDHRMQSILENYYGVKSYLKGTYHCHLDYFCSLPQPSIYYPTFNTRVFLSSIYLSIYISPTHSTAKYMRT